MKSKGIQTSFHYPPVHEFKIYREFVGNPEETLYMTGLVASRQVTLPLFPGMTEAQQDLVVAAVSEALAG